MNAEEKEQLKKEIKEELKKELTEVAIIAYLQEHLNLDINVEEPDHYLTGNFTVSVKARIDEIIVAEDRNMFWVS